MTELNACPPRCKAGAPGRLMCCSPAPLASQSCAHPAGKEERGRKGTTGLGPQPGSGTHHWACSPLAGTQSLGHTELQWQMGNVVQPCVQKEEGKVWVNKQPSRLQEPAFLTYKAGERQVWLLGDASTPPSLISNDLPTNLRLVSSWLQVVAAETGVTFTFQARRKGKVPTTSDSYSGNFPENPSAPEALLARLGPVVSPSQKGSWETRKRIQSPGLTTSPAGKRAVGRRISI